MADFDPKGEVRKSTSKEPATLKTATSKGEYAPGTKDIHHVVITPTEPATKGGPPGFSVEHHYQNSGHYMEPETHAFSPGHHGKMLKHLKKHLGLASSDAVGAAENEGEEE
jgi:hypothetical protein